MAIVLLIRRELARDQAFNTFRVIVLFPCALIFGNVLIEGSKLLREVLSVGNCFDFVIFCVLLVVIVIFQLIDR